MTPPLNRPPLSLVALVGLACSAAAALAGEPTPPPSPGTLGGLLQPNGRVVLTWRDLTDRESGYRISREPAFAEGVIDLPANATQFYDYPGRGAFTYSIVAFNDAGASDPASSQTMRVRRGEPGEHGVIQPVSGGDGNGTRPTAPSQLRAALEGPAVRLQWRDRSQNESYFELERQTSINGTWQRPASFQTQANATSYQDAAPVGLYRYRVRAGNFAAISSYTGWVICQVSSGTGSGNQTPPAQPPAAPSGLAASDIGSGRAMLSWTDNSSDETGFVLERTPPFSAGAFTVSSNTTGMMDQCGDGSFTYRIKAVNAAGASAFTPWVSVAIGNTGGGTTPGGTPGTAGGSVPNCGGGAGVLGVIGADGWTTITPSASSRTIYVSTSGSDSNSGLSESAPKRTIAAAYALMRDRYPDWLLLKRGDTWNEALGHWIKSGRSAAEPMVIGTYGTAPARPLLRTGLNHGLDRSSGGGSPVRIENLALMGIAFTPVGFDGNNDSPFGVWWAGGGTNILIEDCKFEGYYTGLGLQGDPTYHLNTIAVRRNVIIDSFAGGGHAQGLYVTYVDNLLLEENVIDHNGWKVGFSEPDIFKHNVYVATTNTGVTVRGNLITRASSHGLQLRSGGAIERNVFIRNPLAVQLGGGDPDPLTHTNGITGWVTDNVILDGNDITPSLPRGAGIELSNVGAAGAVVERNIVAHKLVDGAGTAITLQAGTYGSGVGARNVVIRSNIVYDWRGPLYIAEPHAGQFQQGHRIEGNDFQDPFASLYSSVLVDAYNLPAGLGTFASNRYTSGRSPQQSFLVNNQLRTYAQWIISTGESAPSWTTASYPDANRTAATYAASRGLPATLEALLDQARLQSRSNWRSEYTADAIAAYIRAGFGSLP